MKLDGLSVYCLRIPFVQGFRHATKDRHESDAIVVEARAEGLAGYGEGLPRDYVTGETERSRWSCSCNGCGPASRRSRWRRRRET